MKDRNQNGKSEEADGDGMENEEVKGAQLSGVPKITELKLPQVMTQSNEIGNCDCLTE